MASCVSARSLLSLAARRLSSSPSTAMLASKRGILTAAKGGMASEAKEEPGIGDLKAMHKLDGFDKWVVYKYGAKYSSQEEVPKRVPKGEFEIAKSKFRMQAANAMMAMVLGACAVMVYLGKNLTKEESMQSVNMERHKKWEDKDKDKKD